MSKIEIRPAGIEEGSEIGDLITTIQGKEFAIPITLSEQPDLADIEGFYRRGHGEFFVAVMDGDIVGTIALIDMGEGEGALRKMFVKKEYRGKEFGVAASLLSHLIDHARGAGLRCIYLGTIEKFHAARRFYAKNGFRDIAKTDLPPSFPLMAVDTHFCVCDI